MLRRRFLAASLLLVEWARGYVESSLTYRSESESRLTRHAVARGEVRTHRAATGNRSHMNLMLAVTSCMPPPSPLLSPSSPPCQRDDPPFLRPPCPPCCSAPSPCPAVVTVTARRWCVLSRVLDQSSPFCLLMQVVLVLPPSFSSRTSFICSASALTSPQTYRCSRNRMTPTISAALVAA